MQSPPKSAEIRHMSQGSQDLCDISTGRHGDNMSSAVDAFIFACAEMNSAKELIDALEGPVDWIDCREWGITPDEWWYAIREALDLVRANEGEDLSWAEVRS